MATTDTRNGTDTDSSKMKPTALVGEIERTRADLARTIDEIADRVTPSRVARRASDEAKMRLSLATDAAKKQLSQVDPLLGGAIALAAVSVTCYLLWRRLRK